MRALSATLDRSDADPTQGTELPPLWHWLYFLPHHAQSEIGVDGHAKRGGFLPPVPLPRRMWAGGRLHWHAPLKVGDAVKRTSTILSVTHKTGRTGDLLFVVVKHDIHNASVKSTILFIVLPHKKASYHPHPFSRHRNQNGNAM
jgi:3-methylfumaryl-CoA hydratase